MSVLSRITIFCSFKWKMIATITISPCSSCCCFKYTDQSSTLAIVFEFDCSFWTYPKATSSPLYYNGRSMWQSSEGGERRGQCSGLNRCSNTSGFQIRSYFQRSSSEETKPVLGEWEGEASDRPQRALPLLQACGGFLLPWNKSGHWKGSHTSNWMRRKTEKSWAIFCCVYECTLSLFVICIVSYWQ